MACVLSLAAMGQALVAPYTLEVLDQPYEVLTDATVMESEVWDTPEGWDDPEFVVPVGFEFDMLETTISTLFQGDLGSTFIGFEDYYDYDNLAAIYLLGDLDLADLGASGNADAGVDHSVDDHWGSPETKPSPSNTPTPVFTTRCFQKVCPSTATWTFNSVCSKPLRSLKSILVSRSWRPMPGIGWRTTWRLAGTGSFPITTTTTSERF